MLEAPPPKPKPPLSARLAGAGRWLWAHRPKLPAWMKRKPRLPVIGDVRVPGTQRTIPGGAVKQALWSLAGLALFVGVVWGVVALVGSPPGDAGDHDAGPGTSIIDNPVVQDPPPPYLGTDDLP